MQFDFIVYLTTNLVNGKRYIGSDSFNRSHYLGSGVFLKQAIVKYGRENFKKEILEKCSSKREMLDRERYWIINYDAVNNSLFYNMSYNTGGMGVGDKHSEETKQRISEKCKGRKHTIEERQKLSAAQIGRHPPNKGKIFDRDSKEYEKAYGSRQKWSPANKDTMIKILEDHSLGMSFIDLTTKYQRTVKSQQIEAFKRRLCAGGS